MGYFKIVTAILIWSSLGIFVRKINMPNSAIIFYPALIAGVFQFSLLILSGLFKGGIKVDRRRGSMVFLLLVPVAFIANSYFFYYAFRNTTIANAVLTHYTAPVFVAFFAPILLKEMIRKTTIYAIMLSSVGLWLIITTSNSGVDLSYVTTTRAGIIAGVLSGLAYAVLIMLIRKIASQYDSLFIIFIQNIIVALLLLPFILSIQFSMHDLPYLIILGLLHSTIAPLLYVQGFHSVRANEAAVLGYFEPVGAILLAFVFFREVPGLFAFLGGFMILLSGYMVVSAGQKRI